VTDETSQKHQLTHSVVLVLITGIPG